MATPMQEVTEDAFAAFELLAARNSVEYAQRSTDAATGDVAYHATSTVPASEPISVLHSQTPVAVTLRTLTQGLASRTGGSAMDATLALLVAMRYCEARGVAVTTTMTARLLVASYRVVAKATHDYVMCAADFAARAGVPPWELCRLETTVLHGIGWAVHAAIGRPAETREHGTASEAMLADEAAARVGALVDLQRERRGGAVAAEKKEEEEAAAARDCNPTSFSVSDMHPGGGPLEQSCDAPLPPAAPELSRDDFRCVSVSASSAAGLPSPLSCPCGVWGGDGHVPGTVTVCRT